MDLINLFDPSLMQVHLTAENSEEVIRKLGQLLVDHQKVTAEYVEEAARREKEFPTGLPTPEVKVALPHTGSSHVLASGLAVGVLEHPVPFRLMGDPEHSADVQVVFLLAIREKTGQVTALQQMVQLLQNGGVLKRAASAADIETLYQAITDGVRAIQAQEGINGTLESEPGTRRG